MGFICAVIFNYVCHKMWSFKSERPHHQTVFLYVGVVSFGLILNGGIVYLGIELTRLPLLLIQGIAILSVITWNYTMFSRVVFCR